ncbi:MAG: LacI family DNA-binding transcriptional regulator [Candidatus Omnitrophica bacterium]|jgi:DNA-binding LacI/PurR family transcriptional regulator|nr:LacI family DNA-binding transcriptional regulator [Candidatus Omnitrophota bacterium]MDD3987670.1 LacI family DNA-binding transcriptional regulator [Candidatus Omnitrophota bacterium]MDD4981141.1 LacI family DNA-binding transcriptional regulator [Candidatus Omnitrophota bacterium]MDD5664889.1 LacI family DNA-binding transcriptional regulator [Candidatus Omnitrophota bacterium]
MTRTKKAPSGIISIEDVAKMAEVSITTVSRVINKKGTVKEKNRVKVANAIKELKFQPSVFAQRLATGKSNVVALIIPRYEGVFYSFYALELIRATGNLCEVFKLDLLLHLTDSHTRNPLNLRGLGGVMFSDIIGTRYQVEEALNSGIPTVIINNYVKDLPVSCIAIDNAGGAENAVNYLISSGHKKIAHISGDVATQAAALRLEGYIQALKKNNIPVKEEYILKTDYSRGQARSAAETLLKMADAPTAVFVASDSMALEVMTLAREMGKNIPTDLSIVGFDDNPSGLYGPVALTTVRQPLIKMAEEGVKELNRLMTLKKGAQPRKIILPTELIIRESCRNL